MTDTFLYNTNNNVHEHRLEEEFTTFKAESRRETLDFSLATQYFSHDNSEFLTGTNKTVTAGRLSFCKNFASAAR